MRLNSSRCAAILSVDDAMGCGSSSKYERSSEELGEVPEPQGCWYVEAEAEQWVALDKAFRWVESRPFKWREEIGRQLLEQYYQGQLEASYVTPEGSFHVDFYQQLQTHESGRRVVESRVGS